MTATATLECPFVVQDPKEVSLCYDVLSWEDTIHKFGVKILQVKVAYILTDRAQEFVRGECENVVAPTRFYRTHTKSCYPGSLKRPTKRSFLHQIWYQCTYGPEDQRSTRKLLVDRSKKPKKGPGSRLTSDEGGPSIKRGCLCYFAIKKLYLWPHISEVMYCHVGHTDNDGNPCHGVLLASPAHKRNEESHGNRRSPSHNVSFSSSYTINEESQGNGTLCHDVSICSSSGHLTPKGKGNGNSFHEFLVSGHTITEEIETNANPRHHSVPVSSHTIEAENEGSENPSQSVLLSDYRTKEESKANGIPCYSVQLSSDTIKEERKSNGFPPCCIVPVSCHTIKEESEFNRNPAEIVSVTSPTNEEEPESARDSA
ncbi:unnamed protein product [Sphagnum troendelagicum]|uniref:Uncharacterized protein n=1 Tax=Sphagnum troendelagicum TaxID=128251 RepID=A0ABP0U678_9BRYO